MRAAPAGLHRGGPPAAPQSRELPPVRSDYEGLPLADAEDWSPRSTEGDDVQLPQDIYGAVIFSVLHDSVQLMAGHRHDEPAFKLSALRFAFTLASLALTYALQLGLLAWSYTAAVAPAVRSVQELYREYHAECFDADGTFNEAKWQDWGPVKQSRLCGLLLSSFWLGYLMLCLWWLAALAALRKTERLRRRIDSVDPATALGAGEKQLGGAAGEAHHARSLHWQARWPLLLLLVLPKLAVGVTLLVVGTWWLLASEGLSDVILHALALGFTIRVDELVFEAMFPVFVEDVVAQLKPRRHHAADSAAAQHEQWEQYRWSAVYWVVILLGAYVYLSFLQGLPWLGVLPSRMDDVPCPGYWQEQTTMVCSGWAVWKGAGCFPYGGADAEELPPHPELYS